MKLTTILESQLIEIGFKYDEDDLYDFLQIKWDEDYISVYDALDGHASEDDWPEEAGALFDAHIEDMKMHGHDLDKFRELSLNQDGTLKLRRGLRLAVHKFVKADEFDDWADSDDAEQYKDDHRDWQADKHDQQHDYARRGMH